MCDISRRRCLFQLDTLDCRYLGVVILNWYVFAHLFAPPVRNNDRSSTHRPRVRQHAGGS